MALPSGFFSISFLVPKLTIGSRLTTCQLGFLPGMLAKPGASKGTGTPVIFARQNPGRDNFLELSLADSKMENHPSLHGHDAGRTDPGIVFDFKGTNYTVHVIPLKVVKLITNIPYIMVFVQYFGDSKGQKSEAFLAFTLFPTT